MENTTDYRVVTEAEEIREYLKGAKVIAFDFETAPRAEWRDDPLAALDAHKADITGVSFSVAPGTGIYIPLAHRDGGNADPEAVIPLLRDLVWENPEVVKIAHNMAFESMFLYAHGIILREPVYDTITWTTRAGAPLAGRSGTATHRSSGTGTRGSRNWRKS